jgi:hypothetical protein
MSASDDTILRLAETPAADEPVSPDEHLITNDRYVLFIARSDHPGFNTVQHLRLSPDTVAAPLPQR